jgi:hypothetical protein
MAGRTHAIARSSVAAAGRHLVPTRGGVPNGDWIAADRQGLTLCDSTAAAFARRLDWPKLDVVTFCWQKAIDNTSSLVIRPSGTEPVIRVMAEGEDRALVESWGRMCVRPWRNWRREGNSEQAQARFTAIKYRIVL